MLGPPPPADKIPTDDEVEAENLLDIASQEPMEPWDVHGHKKKKKSTYGPVRDATADRGFHTRIANNDDRPPDARQFRLGCNLCIKNVAIDATQEQIEGVFGEYGEITSMKMISNPTGDTYLILLAYAEPEMAANAIENLNNYDQFTVKNKLWKVDYNQKDKRDMQRNDMMNQILQNQINHANQVSQKIAAGEHDQIMPLGQAFDQYGNQVTQKMPTALAFLGWANFSSNKKSFFFRPQICPPPIPSNAAIPDPMWGGKLPGNKRNEGAVGTNLCARNINVSLSKQVIIAKFSQFGEITVYHRMITKGNVCLCLISFATPMQAQKARISMHADKELAADGKMLMVDYTIEDKKKIGDTKNNFFLSSKS